MKNGIKAVVLAAGKGTRLRTEGVDLPKVLRQAAGRPCWAMCWRSCPSWRRRTWCWWWATSGRRCWRPTRSTPTPCRSPSRGTGHAVQCAREALAGFDGSVLVCYGDMPLMRRATYESLIETHKREGNDCTLLSPCPTRSCPTAASCGKATVPSPTSWRTRTVPPRGEGHPGLNVGVYVFESRPCGRPSTSSGPTTPRGSTTSPTPQPTSCPGRQGWGPAPAPPRRCWGQHRGAAGPGGGGLCAAGRG